MDHRSKRRGIMDHRSKRRGISGISGKRVIILKGFVDRLSHYCQIDIDRDASTAY